MLDPIVVDENTTISFKFDEFYLHKSRKYEYGIFFRKERMYSLAGVEQPTEIRTYTMRIILRADKETRVKREDYVPKPSEIKKEAQRARTRELLGEPKVEPSPYVLVRKTAKEPILFYFSDSLSQYYKVDTFDCFCASRNDRTPCRFCGSKKTYSIPRYDFLEILKKHDPKLIELLKERLLRKLNTDIVPPKFHNKSEIIWFDDETAEEWGPPVEITENGETRRYCTAHIRKAEYDKYTGKPYSIINPKNFSAYDLPDGYIVPGYEEKTQRDKINNLPKKERIKLFDTLPERVKNYIYRQQIVPRFHTIEERIQSQMPWSLHLAGLDDCSYTKWFPTKKSAEKELQRLRQLQPCHFFRDVKNRKYVFTN